MPKIVTTAAILSEPDKKKYAKHENINEKLAALKIIERIISNSFFSSCMNYKIMNK